MRFLRKTKLEKFVLEDREKIKPGVILVLTKREPDSFAVDKTVETETFQVINYTTPLSGPQVLLLHRTSAEGKLEFFDKWYYFSLSLSDLPIGERAHDTTLPYSKVEILVKTIS